MGCRVTLNVDAMRAQAQRSRAARDREVARWQRRSSFPPTSPSGAIREPRRLDSVAERPPAGSPKDAKAP
jgi:hypothetical protein